MPPENWVNMKSTPITWRQFEMPKITTLSETNKTPESIDLYQNVEFTLTFKTQKRWRSRSRKRFIKLLMSKGISRNRAASVAGVARIAGVPYEELWRSWG